VIRLLALILPLAADTFAVSAALGMLRPPRRRRVTLSLTFAAFEGGMPVVGLALGALVERLIGSLADYLAIAALIGLGAYLLLQNEQNEGARVERLVGSNGITLLGAGIAVSLDELAIGFTLGLLAVPIVAALILVEVQAFVISQLGFVVGTKVGESVREGAERLAGLALMAIGGFVLLGKFVPLPL